MAKLTESYLGSPDNPGTAAIVGYITIIGWLLAYFGLYKSNPTAFAAFHLRQTLMLYICALVVNIYSLIALWHALPLWMVLLPAGMITLLWLWGLIDAANQGQHPVPIVGRLAQRLFQNL